MKIHTVFITYNRLELTKRAVASFVETAPDYYSALLVDNHSTDGTEAWLNTGNCPLWWLRMAENLYPGAATNIGWNSGGGNSDLLHRADNDFIFLPGWRDEVERMFSENPRLGQLGLRTDEEEQFISYNTGGNCVIRRELWDAGLRWDETPWTDRSHYAVGYTEDSFFSKAVLKMGWEWDRVERPCIQSISYEDPSDPYYQQTWLDRGISR